MIKSHIDNTSLINLMHKWDLHQPQAFPNLTYNDVYLARRIPDNSAVVLKICRNQQEAAQEMQALEFYNGNGCVRLLDFDLEKQALLLEHLAPGYSLKTLFPDEENLDVVYAASVMEKLHAQALPEKSNFPTLESWLVALDNDQNTVLPEKQLQKAKNLAEMLLRTQTRTVVLHGDLHHENILFDNCLCGEWKAIDPKGVIGDPCYEIGAFMRNPIPDILNHSDCAKIVSDRIDLFSELLGFEKQRIRDWCYVNAMLSACWALEEGSLFKPEQWLSFLDFLDSKNFFHKL